MPSIAVELISRSSTSLAPFTAFCVRPKQQFRSYLRSYSTLKLRQHLETALRFRVGVGGTGFEKLLLDCFVVFEARALML